MARDPDLPLRTMSWRGLRRRCPRCGTRPFEGYFRMREHCDGCGIRFEREEGYWVGALIINTALTFTSFIVVFVGGILMSWPDVPWGGLMAVTLAFNAAIPIAFYPASKTTWSALELSWHPLGTDEIEAAAERAGLHA